MGNSNSPAAPVAKVLRSRDRYPFQSACCYSLKIFISFTTLFAEVFINRSLSGNTTFRGLSRALQLPVRAPALQQPSRFRYAEFVLAGADHKRQLALGDR